MLHTYEQLPVAAVAVAMAVAEVLHMMLCAYFPHFDAFDGNCSRLLRQWLLTVDWLQKNARSHASRARVQRLMGQRLASANPVEQV